MGKPNNPIDAWSEETVEKIYSFHLDDMHPLDAVSAREIHKTVEQKRAYLKEVEKKFEESLLNRK